MNIIIFLIILVVLILVHEFGHFIAAKKSGVLVEEFGIGFPPRLYGRKIGETVYSINLIPLGGFVRLYGEEYSQLEEGERARLKSRAFVSKPHFQKAIIIIAGIVGNFILGWVLISYLFTRGVPVPTDKVIIDSVQGGSPAKHAKLAPRDVILKVRSKNKVFIIKKADDFITIAKNSAGSEISIEYARDDVIGQTKLTPRKNPPAGQGALGVVITTFEERKYPWYKAPFFGLFEAGKITKSIIVELARTIGGLIAFQKPKADITGPIGIVHFTGQAVKYGQNAVLELVALLSLNLAVINILPFPALDGGRLAFVVYEWVSRRRVNAKFERITNLAGIIILLTLAVVVSIFDVIKFYK